MLRESVRRFAQDVIKPRVAEMDERASLAPEVLGGLFETGLMGMTVAEDFGGSGLSFFSCCLAVEEIARVDPSVAVIVDIQNTLVNTCLEKWGTDDQKNKWLPRLAEDTASSFCLSEPGSGSDAFGALKATATKIEGRRYRLNGEKAWISNAKEAGLFLVMANADPSLGYRGVTCFLVPRDTKGLTIGPPEKKLGIKASSTCPVSLEDVVVDDSAVLGGVGRGYKIAIESLNEGRVGIAAQMVGLAKGALDVALPYVDERVQFGRPISHFQGIQFQIAQAATEVHAAEALVYDVARHVDRCSSHQGKDDEAPPPPPVKEAAMAKLFASQVAERTASRCVEWLGGVGFTTAYPCEKFYRDAKIGAIYEGTSNIQLATIAKYLLNQQGTTSPK